MQKGFSLIEVLIVLAVIAIFTITTIPRMNNSLAQQELETFVSNLAADIRNIQQRAVNANGTSIIYRIYFFNDSSPRYTLHDGSTFKNVYLPKSVELTGAPNYIRFLPSGAPDAKAAQTIEFVSKVTKKRLYIKIAPAIGRVRVTTNGSDSE